MKFTTRTFVASVVLLMAALLSVGASAAAQPSSKSSRQQSGISLADIMNPDDVMLRKPSVSTAGQARMGVRNEESEEDKEIRAAEAREIAEEQARRQAKVRAAAAEQARKDAEARAAAAEKARKEAEEKAAAAEQARKNAEAKAAAEEKARREAEEKAAAEQARKEAEARAAAEQARKEAEARAAADRARKEAEEKAAAEEKARREAEAKTPKLVPPPAQGKTAGQKGQDAGKSAQKKQKQKKQSGRDAVITAERTDYDRKEGVILFDRNVYVDDEQYQLHADRLFLFMDGTNDLKRLVALGNVAITNEEKNASCSRAVYVKKLSKIVMYGSDTTPARLYQGGKKASTVVGERITFWLNSEQVEIEKPVVTVPGGSFKGGDGKDFLKNLKQ